MPGEEGVLQLGQDGVVEAEHALDEGLARGDAGGGVAAELLVDGPGLPPRRPQLAERGGQVGRGGRGRRTARSWARAYAGGPRAIAVGAPGWGLRRSRPAAPVVERCTPRAPRAAVGRRRRPAVRAGPAQSGRGGHAAPTTKAGGRTRREQHTRGPEAGTGRPGRRPGRPRHPDPAAGQLVAQPRRHRRLPERLRRLLDVGRLPERLLLRGHEHAPGPDLALLLPVHHRQLRARGATGAFVITWWMLSPGILDPRRPARASGSPATTTARPTTGASGSRRRRAGWPTATPATPVRPGSR